MDDSTVGRRIIVSHMDKSRVAELVYRKKNLMIRTCVADN